jgi:NAD+ kinase
MGRSVLLLVNRGKAGAEEAEARVSELVRAHGSIVESLEAMCDEPPRDCADVDLIVVLGGDGTLMTVAGRYADQGRPILGVNIGRVGFMAGFDLDSLEAHASELFGEGRLDVRRVALLGARIEDAHGRTLESLRAINDFAITAGPPYRMITLELHFDGQPGPLVSGDGLVVSSPMGSTAYNVSAGGPIVTPGVDATVVTPIAAHSLSFRPIVVAHACPVEVRVRTANEENGGGTELVIDGRGRRRLHAGQRVVIRGGAGVIDFVGDPGVSYWQTLMRKMHWAAPPSGRDGG